jgi:hypothetical protein
MSAKQKQIARMLLQKRDLRGIESWARENRRALSTLFSLTFETDELLRWRAIEAIGIAAAVKARRELELVRDFIRRCIWLMNDESGGLGWHAPEVIGEILVNVPVLIPEYAELLPHYFDEEPFERGAVLAFLRVGTVDPKLIERHADQLVELMAASDPEIRWVVQKALALIHRAPKQSPGADQITLYDFDSGELVTQTWGDSL